MHVPQCLYLSPSLLSGEVGRYHLSKRSRFLWSTCRAPLYLLTRRRRAGQTRGRGIHSLVWRRGAPSVGPCPSMPLPLALPLERRSEKISSLETIKISLVRVACALPARDRVSSADNLFSSGGWHASGKQSDFFPFRLKLVFGTFVVRVGRIEHNSKCMRF